MDVYLTTTLSKGVETMKNIEGKGADEHYIKELGYFSKDKIKNMTVYPKILKDQLWKDYKKGFPEIKFLGVETDGD